MKRIIVPFAAATRRRSGSAPPCRCTGQCPRRRSWGSRWHCHRWWSRRKNAPCRMEGVMPDFPAAAEIRGRECRREDTGETPGTEPCDKTKTGKHEILVRKESADRNDSSVMRTAPGAKTKRRRECPYMGHSFCLENQKRFARILAKTEKMYYDKQTTSFSRRNGSWHR